MLNLTSPIVLNIVKNHLEDRLSQMLFCIFYAAEVLQQPIFHVIVRDQTLAF